MTGALNQNIALFAGDEITIKIPILDAAGNAVPLAGAKGFWFLERGLTPLVSKDETSGVTVILDPVTSIYTMSIPLLRDDTANLAGVFTIRARIVDGDGRLITVSSGRATITASPEAIP